MDKVLTTSDARRGGEFQGESHQGVNNGMRAVIVDNGNEPILVEGSEAIINKKAMNSPKKYTITGTTKQIVSTLNQKEGNGRAIGDSEAEILKIFNEGGTISSQKDVIYNEWKKLVNMSASELTIFYNSEEGKVAGLSNEESDKLGISNGRESSRWIVKMKRTPYSKWTNEMFVWAKKQISFIKRMSGNRGGLYDEDGEKTRKHTSLLIWGHNPEKNKVEFEKGGEALKKMLAPNGKVSNLTAEQYELVRTPAFKKWFGDWENLILTKLNDSGIDDVSLKRLEDGVSKVVDENGEPLVVYHGSKYDFNVFNPDLTGKSSRLKRTRRGVYFSSKINVAESFIHNYKMDEYGLKVNDGSVYKVFLNLKTPNIIYGQGKDITWWDTEIRAIEWSEVRFKDNNEKGFIILNTIDTMGDLVDFSDIYIAYNPNQIKLADGTNTEFDENSDDIRFAKGGAILNNPKDIQKFSKIDISDKYVIEAINEIGLQNTKFDLRSIDATILEEFTNLLSEVDKYVISEDSEGITRAIETEIDARFKQGDSDENISEYKLILDNPQKRKELYIDKYAETQKETLGEWLSYFKLSEYSISLKYLLLKAVLNFNYDYKKNTLIKRTNKTIRNFTPFDAGALGELIQSNSNSLLQDYTQIQISNSKNILDKKELAKTSSGGTWLKFDGGAKTSEENRLENSKELSQLVQNTYWCTKTNSKSQLNGGDFYVYVTENNSEVFPRIAIRMNEDKVGEVRGNNSSSQDLEIEMIPVAKEFLLNNIGNDSGEKWLDSIEYNEKAILLYDKLTESGLFKDSVEEFIELRIKESQYLLDYADRNGHVLRIENFINEEVQELPNKFYRKGEVIFDLVDFDVKLTKIIVGNANFENSKLTDLGNLTTIGGTANFRDSKLTDLGKLTTIGGYADFENSKLTDLGNLTTIGGYADFENSKLTDLGNLTTIGGYANFENSLVTDLGKLTTIGGDAYFGDNYDLEQKWQSLEAKRNNDIRFEEGGLINKEVMDNVKYVDFYNVTVSDDTDTKSIYSGIDKTEALSEYNNPDIPEGYTFNVQKNFDKKTNSYKLIYELDAEYDETIEDFPIEDYYDNEDYYELIEEDDYETLQSESIEMDEEIADREENENVESLEEGIKDYLKSISEHYKNASYMGSTFYSLVPYFDGFIQLRVADHFFKTDYVHLGRNAIWENNEKIGLNIDNVLHNIYGFISINIIDSNSGYNKDKQREFRSDFNLWQDGAEYPNLIDYITYYISDYESIDYEYDINNMIEEVKGYVNEAIEDGAFDNKDEYGDYEMVKYKKGGSIDYENQNYETQDLLSSSINEMIKSGIVNLNFYETTTEHAKEFGIDAKKPLYIQELFVSEDFRLKGIGKQVLNYLNDYAVDNGNDVIFGYVANNSKFTKDSKFSPTFFSDVNIMKCWFHNNGYAVNDDNNDFHKVITKKDSNKEMKLYKIGGSVDSENQDYETQDLLSGEAEKRRKAEMFKQDDIVYNRNKKNEGIKGNTGEVRFSSDVSVLFTYKLIESSELQPSHQNGIRNKYHFIPEAQPKSRNDDGSIQAEDNFANAPRFNELGENSNAYSGAPIVNERDEVVQGNNRASGLKKGYLKENFKYKEDLIVNATKFGFTEKQVLSLRSPILVRELKINDMMSIDLGNYDVKDLETGGKRRLDPVAVTRRMPFSEKGKIVNLLFKNNEEEGQTLNQAIRGNQDKLITLISPFINQAQKNTIVKDGQLTEGGIKDLELVIQYFMFDNADVSLPEIFESLSHLQKEGLRKSLPYIFGVKDYKKSILPEVQDAISALNDFETNDGESFNAWRKQTDIFNDNKTPEDVYSATDLAIAELMLNAKSQKEIIGLPDKNKNASSFAQYTTLVNGSPSDMFNEEIVGVSKKEAVKETFKTDLDNEVEKKQKEVESSIANQSQKEESPTDEPQQSTQSEIKNPNPHLTQVAERKLKKNGKGFIVNLNGMSNQVKSLYRFAENVKEAYSMALDSDLETFQIWYIYPNKERKPIVEYMEAWIFPDDFDGDIRDSEGYLKESAKNQTIKEIERGLGIENNTPKQTSQDDIKELIETLSMLPETDDLRELIETLSMLVGGVDKDVKLYKWGGSIESDKHKEVSVDLSTVFNELNLSDKQQKIYLIFKDVPYEPRENIHKKNIDDYYGKIKVLNKKIKEEGLLVRDFFFDLDKIPDFEDEDKGTLKENRLNKKLYKELEVSIDLKEKEIEKLFDSLKSLEDESLDYEMWSQDEDVNLEIDDLIKRVDARLQTRINVKEGYDLFPEEANIPEFKETDSQDDIKELIETLSMLPETDDLRELIETLSMLVGVEDKTPEKFNLGGGINFKPITTPL